MGHLTGHLQSVGSSPPSKETHQPGSDPKGRSGYPNNDPTWTRYLSRGTEIISGQRPGQVLPPTRGVLGHARMVSVETLTRLCDQSITPLPGLVSGSWTLHGLVTRGGRMLHGPLTLGWPRLPLFAHRLYRSRGRGATKPKPLAATPHIRLWCVCHALWVANSRRWPSSPTRKRRQLPSTWRFLETCYKIRLTWEPERPVLGRAHGEGTGSSFCGAVHGSLVPLVVSGHAIARFYASPDSPPASAIRRTRSSRSASSSARPSPVRDHSGQSARCSAASGGRSNGSR